MQCRDVLEGTVQAPEVKKEQEVVVCLRGRADPATDPSFVVEYGVRLEDSCQPVFRMPLAEPLSPLERLLIAHLSFS